VAARSHHIAPLKPTVLKGRPQVLDALLRPVLRTAALLTGALFCAALWWWGLYAWVPVPLAVAYVVYEGFFWSRRDRPVRVALSEGALEAHDPNLPTPLLFDPSQAHTARVWLHPATAEEAASYTVCVTSPREVLFAARVEGPPPGPASAQIPMDQEPLGLRPGHIPLRALAEPHQLVRQRLPDPKGHLTRWLNTQLPEAAWSRSGVRLWRGPLPPLDPLGHHVGPHDALLVLEDDRWTLHSEGPTQQGTVTFLRLSRTERDVELLSALAARWRSPEENKGLSTLGTETVQLPLCVAELSDDLTLAFPSLRLGVLGRKRGLPAEGLHCHLAEGALVLWHIVHRWPTTAWPTALQSLANDLADAPSLPHAPVSTTEKPS